MSSAETPLRVLEELGRELDGVIARESVVRAPQRLAHTLVLALLGVLLATGVAAAASYVLTGSPIPGSHGADVPPEATPRPGSARLAGLDAADPGGGPAWDLRVSRSETGQLCSAVGQVVEGKFGLVGLDSRFRRLPLAGVDACGDRALAAVLIGARVFDAASRERVRTVVNGVGGNGLREVQVTTAEGASRALRPGSGGTFLAVYSGYVEELRPQVRLTYADGSQRSFAFGVSAGGQDRDPDGGPRWVARASRWTSGSRAGQTCVQARRAHGRTQRLSPLMAPLCGDLDRDALFFDVAAFPRGGAAGAQRGRFPWGSHAPRTLVWGAASDTVRAIEVEHGGSRRLVDLSGDGTGFIAVLPGGTDPFGVRVHVTLADGTSRSYTGGQNLRAEGGAPQRSELRHPVAVDPGPVTGPARSSLVAIDGTTRIELRVRARDGGGDWALRSWRARGRGSGRLLDCVALGRLVAGVFRLPGATSAEPPSDVGAVCAASRERRAAITSRDETLLDDGLAYAPRPVATVVWGLAPAGARDVTVGGLGPSAVVRSSRRGAFLAVAPPARLERGAVIRARVGGRRVSSSRPGFRPAAVVAGSARIETRAPDPEGAQPWGELVWRLAGGRVCTSEGRIVGDQVGSVDQRRGAFHPVPLFEAGRCDRAPTEPVVFGITSGMDGDASALSPGRARVQRRTLPGRTVVSGFARGDVRAVTVRTPRDVRTLRPSGRSGAFLVVYDGEFFGGGEVAVDALLASGRTVRSTLELPL